MLFCSKCGKELDKDVRFCPKCGAPVGAPARPVEAHKTRVRTRGAYVEGEDVFGARKVNGNWFARHAAAEAKKDVISYSERAGCIVGVAAILLIIFYFVAHQTRLTGFFTSKFGTLETLLFYASLLFGMATTAIRGLLGRKNLTRLFEIFESVLSAFALTWLIGVFPFDFTHLADVLPSFLRFLLQWISNDIARVLMVLGIIVSLIMAIYNVILYVLVRRELSKSTL